MSEPNLQEIYFDRNGRPTIAFMRLWDALRILVNEGGSGTVEGISDFAYTFLDDESASEVLATLGAQPADDDLDTLSGSGVTSAGLAVLSAADVAAQQELLGIEPTITGVWSVVLSDASGNQSATTTSGQYERRGRVVHAWARLGAVDTTGMTGTDAVRISLPTSFNGGIGGTLVTDAAHPGSGTQFVPYAVTASGTEMRIASIGGTIDEVTVADMSSHTLHLFLTYALEEVSASITADTTALTADSTVITADAA